MKLIFSCAIWDCTIFRECVAQETCVMTWSSKPQAHHEKHGHISLSSFCWSLICSRTFEKLVKCNWIFRSIVNVNNVFAREYCVFSIMNVTSVITHSGSGIGESKSIVDYPIPFYK